MSMVENWNMTFICQIVILYFSLFRDSFYLSDMTYAVFYNVLSFPLFFLISVSILNNIQRQEINYLCIGKECFFI